MRNVGSSSALDDGAHLTAFVDRIAGPGGDEPTATARARITKAIEDGAPPAGLRKLAEALAASVDAGPPQPRHASEDTRSVVTAARSNNLVVLDRFGREATAAALVALLTEGHRVVVTGADAAELTALREMLPAELDERCVETLPGLAPAEQRTLRRLLATGTPERRAREDQQVPPAAALPGVDEVARLCRRADSGGEEPADLVPGLLSELEPDRRDALTGVASCVARNLDALRPHEARAWAWSLLSDLVLSTHRTAFDRLLADTTQAAAAAQRASTGPAVSVTGPLPPDADEVLRRYLEFLKAGGRTRGYFRAGPQRDVQPVLSQLRVGDAAPQTVEEIEAVLDHLQLAGRLVALEAGCREVGVPAPRGAGELIEVAETLTEIGAAARSVGALRHDVLFLHPTSPIAAPDLASAEQIAAAILDYAEHGSAAEAEQRLDTMAAELAGLATVHETAPEHARAVAALRDRDPVEYAAAVDALAAAARDVADQQQCTTLLDRLRTEAPRLAEAWAAAGESGSGGFGLGWFVEIDTLLAELPDADEADIVLVLGAAELGVDRLLLTAVAPRLVAVCGHGPQAPSGGPTMLGVLQRASALVVGASPAGRAGTGRVVRLPAGGEPRAAVPAQRSINQAGA